MSWDDLFSEELEPKSQKLEPPKLKNSKKKRKLEPCEFDAKTKKKPSLDIKSILTIQTLWSQLLTNKDAFGMGQLLCLLSGKKMSQLDKLHPEKVEIKRTPAAEAIIELFRILKKEGFI